MLPILSKFFNAYLTNAVWPELLKVAKAIPVFKKGKIHKAFNHRLILCNRNSTKS